MMAFDDRLRRLTDDVGRGQYEVTPRMRQIADEGLRRCCPGLPGHPDGPCPNPPEPGDRYCGGCRAEFDATSDGGWDR